MLGSGGIRRNGSDTELDRRLFRCYTSNSSKKHLQKCNLQMMLPYLLHQGLGLLLPLRDIYIYTYIHIIIPYIHVCIYVYTYMKIAACFGLSLNVQKTKLMVTGREEPEEDRTLIRVAGGDVECITEFPYLGSVISSTGRMRPDVQRIARASRVFGARLLWIMLNI